ncbi:endonuclease domain-containing protein [Spongiivirga citrea]|uniref:DUF559 domain-containing protein n=1 Tax=Spongiivirga citrea TaxID=1481457 RepID=A0A6M0CKA2_9FLAO|nr:DUF559 domain-containing protein [Spongiivirga citrea]NER17403.1 DUF559 domain-containing protein [Spongiivirga citrea]
MRRIIPYSKESRILSRVFRKQMTFAEKILWKRIRKNALGTKFRRQFPVLDYILDFYAKDIGLAIEVDGGYHENQFLEDAERQGRIEELGIRFIRFTNEEIENDIDFVLERLKKEIEEYK